MKNVVRSTRFWYRSGLAILLTAVPLYVLSTVWNVAATFEESAAAGPPATAKLSWPQLPQTIKVADHPRLLFETASVAALKSRAATTHNEIWLPIEAFAEAQMETPPPMIAPLEADEDAYRNFGNQLIPIAFSCLVTDAENHCELAKSYLLAYASWEQWGNNNWRDLGHSHMLLANALAYDWLYQKLTPSERQTVRLSLGNWAHKMYEASLGPKDEAWNNWWHKSYVQNHYWINNSALGLAGLALYGEDDRAVLWTQHAVGRLGLLQTVLNAIEDGSWHEGIAYQNYGLTLTLPFLVNLRTVSGVDILPHSYLGNYPYWRIYNYLPDTSQPVLAYGNFEPSWGNSYRAQNILRFTAGEYHNRYAEWMAQKLIEADGRYANVFSTPWYVFEFFYYEPAVSSLAPDKLETARVFRDLEGVIWRTGWADDDLIFALKSGAYGGRFAHDSFTTGSFPWEPPCSDTECQLNIGHEHNDANTIYLYRAGQPLVPETVGVGNYDTFFHNSILIDDQEQYRPDDENFGRYPEDFIDSDGFLEATAHTENFSYVAADATRRYRQIKGLEDVTRHVLFIRPNYLVMLDNLAANKAHDYAWISHLGENVSIQGNWVRGDAAEDETLGILVVAPEAFKATTGDDGQPFVRLRPVKPAADVRFITLLYPTNTAAWRTRPDVTNLDDTGSAAWVEVRHDDGQIDDVWVSYGQAKATNTVGPFRSDSQAAVISRNVDGNLDKLFLHGGTFLTDETRRIDLVKDLTHRGTVDATYAAQTVIVTGYVGPEMTLYAPQTKSLIYNGLPWPFTKNGDYIRFEVNHIFLPLRFKS